jgi:hypothetical protein
VAGAVQQAMNSGGRVPETWLLGEGELSADHAWRAPRRYGSWRLLRDAFLRFRSGDGFSHARALGLQLCLAAVPLLIALNGLASKLGDPQRAGRVVDAKASNACASPNPPQTSARRGLSLRAAARSWATRPWYWSACFAREAGAGQRRPRGPPPTACALRTGPPAGDE